MSNQNPRFLDLARIYWSITWRANILGVTIVIILFFCICPFLLHILINVGKLEAFRAHLFSLSLFPASAEKIKPLSSSIVFYFSIWGFAWDYLIFRHSFRRVLQLKIYPYFFKNFSDHASYNRIFPIPLILYYFIEPLLFGFVEDNSGLKDVLTIFFLSVYFLTVLALLKRTIKN